MLGWIFNCSESTGYIDLPFPEGGTLATHTQLHKFNSAVNLSGFSTQSEMDLLQWQQMELKATLHCVGECLTPTASTASLFLHQIHDNWNHPKAKLDRKPVSCAADENWASIYTDTRHKTPLNKTAKLDSQQATLFIMIAERSQENPFFSPLHSQAFLPQGHICCLKLNWFFSVVVAFV